MAVRSDQTERGRFRRGVAVATRRLALASPHLGAWIAEFGPCQWEVAWERSPYESLVRAIAHQQLTGRAAQTMLGRFKAGFRGHPFPTPRQIARAAPAKLRAMGFSTAKVTAIQGIAAATVRGEIPDRQTALSWSDAELIAHLTQLRGVGQWTVEMLLIFTLGRMDVMPADDFGVQSGLMHLLGLGERPKKARLAELTETWRPYRSVGAWYLWRKAEAARPRPKG